MLTTPTSSPHDGGSALRVAQVVHRTTAEGPGLRMAIWVQGCPLGCPGCCNPEMLPDEGGEVIPVEALARQAASVERIEGITLVGGEPFAQPRACAALAAAARAAGLSVMVFTGYLLDELRAAADPAVGALLTAADLLVDGPYLRQSPEAVRRWIGSRNQTLHFLTDRYAPGDPRFDAGNTLEIRLDGASGELVVNGWPAAARRVEQ